MEQNKYWVVVEVNMVKQILFTRYENSSLLSQPNRNFPGSYPEPMFNGDGLYEPSNFISGRNLTPQPELKLIGIFSTYEKAMYAVSGYSNRKVLGPSQVKPDDF